MAENISDESKIIKWSIIMEVTEATVSDIGLMILIGLKYGPIGGDIWIN